MTQLATRISDAVDAELVGVRQHLDAELSARGLALHYGAIAVPRDGEPDRRTVGMKRYALTLSRDRVVADEVEVVVAKMFADSLEPSFFQWVGRFCASNPKITEADVADRLRTFAVFIALRSVTSNESEIDKLFDAEELARVKYEEAVSRCKESIRRAKDKVKTVQGEYDKASRLRVRASRLTDEVNTLTLHVPTDFRDCVLAAQVRHLRRQAHPTRIRKRPAGNPAPPLTSDTANADSKSPDAGNPALGLTAAEAAKAVEKAGKKGADNAAPAPTGDSTNAGLNVSTAANAASTQELMADDLSGAEAAVEALKAAEQAGKKVAPQPQENGKKK